MDATAARDSPRILFILHGWRAVASGSCRSCATRQAEVGRISLLHMDDRMSMFVMLLLDETYAPPILTTKTRKLRFETKDWALHAQHEEWPVNLHGISVKYLIRPFQLLGNPTCFLMAFYGSFGFELSFGDHRGWPGMSAELPFMALMLGIMIGGLANSFNSCGYVKRMKANNGKPVRKVSHYVTGLCPLMRLNFPLRLDCSEPSPLDCPLLVAGLARFRFPGHLSGLLQLPHGYFSEICSFCDLNQGFHAVFFCCCIRFIRQSNVGDNGR
ncbi:Efflux pump bik6 [Trichoderma lentiforme]|uniref:Efflux pump bik6 n=1 Tax=Trichoderma lentiforme TaxID=1567552 RepID=A0A9P4X2L3_9HYPO|nr:Efflux pump bik6 [Trichoderma lentiforme]